jgi:hypothetical protein
VPRRRRLSSQARAIEWRSSAVRPLAHRRLEPAAARAGDLGRDQHGVARLRLQPLRQDLLGAAGPLRIGRHGIHLGGVEEEQAGVPGLVEDRQARGLVGHRAEGHRAEPDLGHDQAAAAEPALLHRDPSRWLRT